jgi:Holliday junction resolvase-like predicted endonuclease
VATQEQRRRAIRAAKVYLEMRGFLIIELGFQRPRGAVDIIAKQHHTTYFVEVIYSRQDDSIDYATSRPASERLQKLRRGAASWLEESKSLLDFQFASIELAGADYSVLGFIDQLLY